MNSYRVICSEFAEHQVDAIYEYYCFRTNPEIAKKLVRSIIGAVDPLKQNPYIGQSEEVLKRLEKNTGI
ncbi:MAG: type II toxin-antitoxin system RelE/ParE family toxin [Cyclobacteriaceae bacterium]